MTREPEDLPCQPMKVDDGKVHECSRMAVFVDFFILWICLWIQKGEGKDEKKNTMDRTVGYFYCLVGSRSKH